MSPVDRAGLVFQDFASPLNTFLKNFHVLMKGWAGLVAEISITVLEIFFHMNTSAR